MTYDNTCAADALTKVALRVFEEPADGGQRKRLSDYARLM